MGKTKNGGLGKNGQEAQLRSLVKNAFVAVGIGIFLLLGFVIFNLVISNMQTVQLNAALALDQYRVGSKTLTYAVRSYAVTGEQKYSDAYFKELNEDQNREKARAALEKCRLTEQEWANLNEIANLSENLVPLEEQAIAAAENGDLDEAQACVFTAEYGDAVDQINAETDETIREINARKDAQQSILKIVQILLALALMVSFAFLVWQIVKTIKFASAELLEPIKKVSDQMAALADGDFKEPLDLKEDDSEVGSMVAAIAFMKQNLLHMVQEISEVLEQMGNGNYNIQLEQEYVGEFTKIRDSLTVIIAKMRETLTTLKEVTVQIDSGSEQLAYAAEDLAQGSTDQAGQVSELVSVFEGMTQTMERNVDRAKESVDIASKAGYMLTQGNTKMQELKTAIGEISRCSEQIGTIIGTIESIASQTNLLSLNAAIEAARAGEAGKGFAVVADEIGKLALESSKAANTTKELIEISMEEINKGNTIAVSAVNSLKESVDAVSHVNELIQETAENAAVQAENMNHLRTGIKEISHSIQDNSAASQETSATSEELASQAERLNQMVQRFELNQ